MRHCAFLTLEDPGDFVIDDELAYEPLAELGWRVEAVPWTRPGVRWGDFDVVVIRSPWDYPSDPDAFLAVLGEIERSGTMLFNGLDLVRWNLRKTYLREVEARRVPIVPTIWRDHLAPGDLVELFEAVCATGKGVEEIVLKPVVGANADGAFRLDRHAARDRAQEVEAFYTDRELMAQPFAHAILDEGEYSLFYFDGEHSHAILKTPKTTDFRVQEEHGARIRRVEAGEALLAAAEAALRALGKPPLYARVDLVRANDGTHDGADFWLMELELIEPSLYLRMDPEAPRRFARALHRRVVAPIATFHAS